MFELVPRIFSSVIAYFVLIGLAIFLFELIDDDTSTHVAWVLRTGASIGLLSILVDAFHLGLSAFRGRR